MKKQWQYLVARIAVGDQEDLVYLDELGDGGWEAVTSWVLPPEQHINAGKPQIFCLFKHPKSK